MSETITQALDRLFKNDPEQRKEADNHLQVYGNVFVCTELKDGKTITKLVDQKYITFTPKENTISVYLSEQETKMEA